MSGDDALPGSAELVKDSSVPVTLVEAEKSVASDFRGRFEMKGGAIHFSELGFRIPGAAVQLIGTYNIDADSLDFRGTLHMQAKVSETTSGAKSFFLKLVDPLFKGQHGGSAIPIKISGQHEHPQVGLDSRRVIK